MARPQNIRLTQALASVLPRRRIRILASRCGAVRRRRKLDIVALVYSLVLGFGAGDKRTLTGLRRAYHRATGTRLAASTFYARFNAGLVRLMRELVVEAIDKLDPPRPRRGSVFAPFREVLAIDSTLVRLHNALEDAYPSVWRNYMRASAKLTVVMNVLGRGAKTLGMTHGSRHDVHLLEAGPWVKGRLLIFDLGFFRATLFKAVDHHGGYFLCRLRKKSNPVIESTNTNGYAHLIGRKLKDVMPQLRHTVFDFDGRLGYQERLPPHTTHDVHFRVVCLYNRELDTWHSYVTNLPPSMLIPEDLGAVYAARWEVELFFRELKSHYRLDQLPTKNRHITECLIYAAFLTVVLARKLYQHLLSPRSQDRRRLPFDRWAAIVADVSQELLQLLLSRRDRRFREHRLARYLRREAVDPNATRMTLATRAEVGIFGPA